MIGHQQGEVPCIFLSTLIAGTIPVCATWSINSQPFLLINGVSITFATTTSLDDSHGGRPKTGTLAVKTGREEFEDLHCHSCQLRRTTRQFLKTQCCKLGEDASQKLTKVNLLQVLRQLL